MKKSLQSLGKISFFMLSLSLLSSCKFFQKSGDNAVSSDNTTNAVAADDVVLCKINGKPSITKHELDRNIEQMLQANPYFKGAKADTLPLPIKHKFYEEMLKLAIICEHQKKQGVEKLADYQKAWNDSKKLLEQSLMVQFFEKSIFENINISDDEVVKNFNENKDRYIKTPGGVLVGGVRFDNETQARAFMEKINKTELFADFEKAAKEFKGGHFKNFGRVNKDAKGYQFEMVPASIKEAALATSTLPHVELVKAGKDIWVIHVSDKKDAEFFTLDEIKPQITGMLKNNKFKDALDQKLKDIRTTMNIETNEDFFKEKKEEVTAEDDKQVEEDEQPVAAAAA